MDQYRLSSHDDVPDREPFLAALSELEALTFSHYDGVVHSTPEFLRWYTARPGMRQDLCQAAFAGEQLVANVFVTLAPMMLGGEVVTCGILDTVMTHPNHRRRGLATELLQRALAAMAAGGADVSLLYTAREDPMLAPERLYGSLDYAPRELVTRFMRPAAAVLSGPAPIRSAHSSIRHLFAEALGRDDGWILLDDQLWQWRRVARPRQYPVSLHVTGTGAAAAICSGELILSGARRPLTVVSDIVLPLGDGAKTAFESLLAAAPAMAPVTVLCPQSDARMVDLLSGLGFAAAGAETVMMRGITDRGAAALARPLSGWYVAVESVIGV